MIFEQFHYSGDRLVNLTEANQPLKRSDFNREYRRLVVDPSVPLGGYSGRVVREVQDSARTNEGHESLCGSMFYHGKVYRDQLRRLIIERIYE